MSNGAPSYWGQVSGLVGGNLSTMNNRADSALNTANQIISRLASLQFDLAERPPGYNGGFGADPGDAAAERPEPPEFTYPEFSVPEWSEIDVDLDDLLRDLPDLRDVPDPPLTIRAPDAPQQGPVGAAPERPTSLPEITVPEFNPADYQFPSPPDYLTINVPTAPDVRLDPFTETIPEFTETPPNPAVNFTPEQYESVLLESLKSKVQEMLAGGIGLPESVEQGLYDRARARDDMASAKAVDEAFDTFAARGFTLPPGALVKQVNAAIEDNRLKAQGHTRDVLIEAAKWRIENVRAALERGVAIEAQLIQSHDTLQRLSFEAIRAHAEFEVSRFNLLVSAYDVRARVFGVKLQAWEAGLKLVVERINAYRAQVEAEKAKADVNESMTRAYTAAIQAVVERIGIFRARVEAEVSKANITRALLEAYGEETRAYQAQVQASLIDYQRFEAEARVEVAKGGINEAYLRAFAETLNSQNAIVNAKARAIEVQLGAINAANDKFRALVQGEAAEAQAIAQIEGLKAQVFGAQIGLYSADVSLAVENRRLSQQRSADTLRNALANHEINVRQYDAQQARLIEVARIQSEAIRAAGQMAAQLAAGAMAAINVGANLSGSTSDSTSFSNSYSQSFSKSINYSYDAEDGPPPF
jgi:hypothetical protein